MTQSSALLAEMEGIMAYIEASRAIVKDGYMPDMSPLEKRMASLCEGIQAAEAQEQSRCLPRLAALLKALGECEQDLRAWNEARKVSNAP